MAKRRDYFEKPVSKIDTCVLRQAAAVLEYDAELLSKTNQRDIARVARHYAKAIRAVANGRTWTEAFDFDAPSEKPQ